MSEKKPHATIIVKPTNECNLRCKYCYAADAGTEGTMTEDTLYTLIDNSLDVFNNVHFIWHGGEPLIPGVGFYETLIELQSELKEADQRITNSIQSNLTLLDDDFLDFFQQHDFKIGTSIDGPREIHNRTRVYHDGSGTFDDVMHAIGELKAIGITPGAIAVITKENVDHCEEIYRFFKQEAIPFKLNPVFECGRAKEYSCDLSVKSERYSEAMIKLFDLWVSEPKHFPIDTFDEIVGNIVTGKPRLCSYTYSCQEKYFAVASNGDVYPCGRFDGEKQFRFGNINSDDFDMILTSDLRNAMVSRADKIGACAPCEYKTICNGGCPHNAYTACGDPMEKDGFCDKPLISHIHHKLLSLTAGQNVGCKN